MIRSTKEGVYTIEGDEHDQEHKGGGGGMGMEGLNIRGDDKHDKNTQKSNDYEQ